MYQQAAKTSHFYKGFSTVNEANIGNRLYDFDLIKQDIINHFNTRKGSRLMLPEFGSIIWDLLMEPLTDQIRDLLTADIKTICNFDPRVTPTQIDLTEYSTGYVLELTLLLVGTDVSSNMKLAFDQKIGLRSQ
jgi:phage baseplate assembly protein W